MRDSMQRPSRSSKLAALILALVVLLPMLYVLSTGPALWLAIHHTIEPDTFERFYLPLGWMMDHSKPVDSAVRWYLSLWVPEAGY